MQRKSAARCLPQLQSLRHLRTTVIKRPSRPVAKKINPIIQQLDTEVMLQKLPEVQIPTETTSSSTPAHIDDSTLGRSWTWVPPRKVEPEKEEKFFSIIPGVHLTENEIVSALEAQGAEDIRVISLVGKMSDIDYFVICTGRSTKHLRKLTDMIVKALKDRGLDKIVGYKGAEGEIDDDWLLVDCGSSAVHCMLADTRRALDLESHWTAPSRPSTLPAGHPRYEEHFQELLDQYPIPPEYAQKLQDELDKEDKSASGRPKHLTF